MRLAQIRAFLAIAETGSIRSAARALGISQPALTKSVQQLEKELRTQLLQRTNTGAMPTRPGKAFLARARVIQAELRKAEEELAQLRANGSGSVSIGISPTAIVALVPEMLLRFQRRHPQCSIHVIEGVWSSLQPLVREETLDLAVVLRTPDAKADPALRFRPLYRTRLAIAGRRGHPLRAAGHLRDLAGAPWLMFGPPGDSALLAQYFGAASLPPPSVTVQCESYAAALAVLARTDTLGLVVPEAHVDAPLQRVEVAELPPEVAVGMLTRADTSLTPFAREMAKAAAAASRRLAEMRARSV